MLRCILFTLPYVTLQRVNTDAFASTTELRQLLASEHEIIAGMEEYIAAEEERIQELKEYVSLHWAITFLAKHDKDF